MEKFSIQKRIAVRTPDVVVSGHNPLDPVLENGIFPNSAHSHRHAPTVVIVGVRVAPGKGRATYDAIYNHVTTLAKGLLHLLDRWPALCGPVDSSFGDFQASATALGCPVTHVDSVSPAVKRLGSIELRLGRVRDAVS